VSHQFAGTMEVQEKQRFDVAALEAWMRANVEGFRGPLTVEQFRGGQSNPTFRLATPGKRYVMRRKPAGKLLPSAHAVDREFRVITALAGSDVPVPRTYGLCMDDAVIGSAFFVMDFADGRVLWDGALPGMSNAERAAIYWEMNRVIAALHQVDFEKRGLGDYGKPGNYFARQIGRWTKQYQASETETIESMNHLIEWLPQNIPANDETTIVHGDYRLDNCLLTDDGDVAAVLDWEICTLGDPRADVGYVLATWAEAGDPLRADDHNPTLAAGFTNRTALLDRYAERSGRDVSDIPFFVAFSFWRLACILEGVLARILAGARGDADVDVDYFRRRVESCALLAEEYASGL
jgi:aminoglycoside phosphotransferase (APT) family kinase protein